MVSVEQLEGMSLKELRDLQKKVDSSIKTADERNRKRALAAAEQAVAEFGLSLQELAPLIGIKASGEAKSPIPPKFRSPENPELTWSGRGKRPRWFTAALADGASEDDLLIK